MPALARRGQEHARCQALGVRRARVRHIHVRVRAIGEWAHPPWHRQRHARTRNICAGTRHICAGTPAASAGPCDIRLGHWLDRHSERTFRARARTRTRTHECSRTHAARPHIHEPFRTPAHACTHGRARARARTHSNGFGVPCARNALRAPTVRRAFETMCGGRASMRGPARPGVQGPAWPAPALARIMLRSALLLGSLIVLALPLVQLGLVHWHCMCAPAPQRRARAPGRLAGLSCAPPRRPCIRASCFRRPPNAAS
jgi:hypothetical protein